MKTILGQLHILSQQVKTFGTPTVCAYLQGWSERELGRWEEVWNENNWGIDRSTPPFWADGQLPNQNYAYKKNNNNKKRKEGEGRSRKKRGKSDMCIVCCCWLPTPLWSNRCLLINNFCRAMSLIGLINFEKMQYNKCTVWFIASIYYTKTVLFQWCFCYLLVDKWTCEVPKWQNMWQAAIQRGVQHSGWNGSHCCNEAQQWCVDLLHWTWIF